MARQEGVRLVHVGAKSARDTACVRGVSANRRNSSGSDRVVKRERCRLCVFIWAILSWLLGERSWDQCWAKFDTERPILCFRKK